MSAGFTRLFTEAMLNVRAFVVTSLVIAAVAFALGATIILATSSQVSSAVAQQQELQARGVDVWRVQPSQPMSAAVCDDVRMNPGVLDSGARLSARSTRIASIPGASARIVTATPGYIRIMWPESPPGLAIGAGSEISTAFGLRPGTVLALESAESQRVAERTVLSDVLPPSSRGGDINQVLVVASAPDGKIRECLVEAHPGTRAAVEAFLVSHFSGATITPLYVDTSLGDAPEDQLRNRISQWIPLAGAIAVIALTLLTFFSRRADWALYQVVGVGKSARLLMLTAETATVVWFPFAAGAMVSSWIFANQIADPMTASECLSDLARALLLLVLIPPLALLALSHRAPLAWLKGE